MEYGILGLLPRLFCFIWLIRIGLRAIKPLALECKKGKKADQKKINQLVCLAGFGIGMLGLALEGMVLHSFVDRMVALWNRLRTINRSYPDKATAQTQLRQTIGDSASKSKLLSIKTLHHLLNLNLIFLIDFRTMKERTHHKPPISLSIRSKF